MRVEYRDLAVFTRNGGGGNPLAVVPFGSVPSSRWQEVAAAIGYAETVFLEPGSPAVVHIYTPGGRIPFAGHPLVGTASILADDVDHIRYDSGVAAIERADDSVAVTVVSDGEVRQAPPPSYGTRAWVVEMPWPYVLVEVAHSDVVAGLAPAEAAEMGEEVYVWAWESHPDLIRARFFAPGVGVPEDPATGSAAVALSRTMAATSGRILVHQGEEMGSPSEIQLSWDGTRVTIGGTVSDRGLSGLDL